MADVDIKYKGASIATMSASGIKTLQTSGKYCEDNITVEYNVNDRLKKWNISLASDTVAGENIILIGDAWIAQNWNNPSLWLFFTTKDLASTAERSLWCFNGNPIYIYDNIFGVLCRKQGANITLAASYGPPDNRAGTQQSNRIFAYSSGNVTVSTTSTGTYPFKAGNYELYAFIGG